MVKKNFIFNFISKVIKDYSLGGCSAKLDNCGNGSYIISVVYSGSGESGESLYYYSSGFLGIDKEDADGEYYTHEYDFSNDTELFSLCELLIDIICHRLQVNRVGCKIDLRIPLCKKFNNKINK